MKTIEYYVDGVYMGKITKKMMMLKWDLAIKNGYSWRISKDKFEIQTHKKGGD